MKNRKTGKAIAAAAMLTIAAMTMPMQTVSAEDIVDAPYNVVVLGDSISTGYGLEDSSKSYVSVLEHHMNQKVTNLAKDGTTSSELLQSLQGDGIFSSNFSINLINSFSTSFIISSIPQILFVCC